MAKGDPTAAFKQVGAGVGGMVGGGIKSDLKRTFHVTDVWRVAGKVLAAVSTLIGCLVIAVMLRNRWAQYQKKQEAEAVKVQEQDLPWYQKSLQFFAGPVSIGIKNPLKAEAVKVQEQDLPWYQKSLQFFA